MTDRGMTGTRVVELLGRYSNRNVLSKLRQVVAGDGRDQVSARPVRSHQLQHRLNPDEVQTLLATYNSGAALKELAERFSINHTTVVAILGRAGAERRYKIVDRHIDEARKLYESGVSLVQVGQHFGVRGATVRNAFMRQGVAVRKAGSVQAADPSV